MTGQPPFSLEPEKSTRAHGHESVGAANGGGLLNLTGMEHVRLACKSLGVFGRLAGWGTAAVGVLIGALHLVEASERGPSPWQGWARSGLEAAIAVVGFGLAGWAVAAFSRLIGRGDSGTSRTGVAGLRTAVAPGVAQAIDLLERLTWPLKAAVGRRLRGANPALDRRGRWPRSSGRPRLPTGRTPTARLQNSKPTIPTIPICRH